MQETVVRARLLQLMQLVPHVGHVLELHAVKREDVQVRMTSLLAIIDVLWADAKASTSDSMSRVRRMYGICEAGRERAIKIESKRLEIALCMIATSCKLICEGATRVLT